MDILSLFLVASMPIIQVLLIGLIGAFLASDRSNILTACARKDMNKVVFHVFTPALMFTSLAMTVTIEDVKSWWFMPVNIGIVYVSGGILGWLAAKLLKLPLYLQPVMTAFCSAGNFGNLLLIIVPAVCEQEGNPFPGSESICKSRGLSYSSFSMALGGFFIWTHTYSIMKKAGKIYHKTNQLSSTGYQAKTETSDSSDPEAILLASSKADEEAGQTQINVPLLSDEYRDAEEESKGLFRSIKEVFVQFVEELLEPPTISAILGFVVGAIPWLKSLIIGENAPFHVIQETLQLLGNGTIPVITLILGGNLTHGFHKSVIRRLAIVAIICIRYLILPIIGIVVVKMAYEFGFLPDDPMYRYVLMIQFTVPPAMNIATMAQLFDVAHEESSVIFLWTYLVAAIAITAWSTVFMWVLS
ncbi:protein PIN-LIKES 7-like [Carex rostrata]